MVAWFRVYLLDLVYQSLLLFINRIPTKYKFGGQHDSRTTVYYWIPQATILEAN